MNSDYDIIGKVETTMPNLIVSVSDKRKPVYKGDVCELPAAVKKQIVDHFYDNNGKRNRKTVFYWGINPDITGLSSVNKKSEGEKDEYKYSA